MSFSVTANQSSGFGIQLQSVNRAEDFQDDFNDNSLSTAKWSEWTPGNVTESGGQLRIPSVTASDSWLGMQSVSAWNLTGSYFHIEVPHILTGLNGAYTDMQLAIDDNHTITMFTFNNQLSAEYQVNGVWSSLGSVTYNSTLHRWWRIRESGGTLYYEHSPNGIDWNLLVSTPNPFAVTALHINLFIGLVSANATTDTAIFDNLNTLPILSTPRGQYRNDQRTAIPIGELTDGDGVANNVWTDLDVYSDAPSTSTTPAVEVRPIASSFTNVATVTATPSVLRQSELPNSRRGTCMVYDAKNKRFIVFGGYNGTTRFNEVWELSADSAYHRWKKLNPTGTAPTGRNLAASTYVRGTTSGAVDKAYMLIWGGSTPSDSNQMFALDVSTPGSEAWTTITQTNTPSVRSYITHHMVAKQTASNTSDVYFFGGWGSSRTNEMLRCTFNVNSPGSVTWTTLKANGAVGSPVGRSGAGLVYDSANDRIIITSGYTGSAYLSDVWEYKITTNTFTQISTSGSIPAGRELPNIGYDPVNQRAIMAAGWQGSSATARNDVYQLTLTPGSESWTQLQAYSSSNQAILAFSSGAAAVDPVRNLLVITMIHGFDATDKYVYAFDMNDTSPSAPLGSLVVADDFRARDAPACVVDPDRQELVFINGYSAMDDDATIANGEHIAEVWAYSRTDNRWRFAMGGPVGMPQSEGGIAIYDTANQRIIHFGGLVGSSQMTNDVWELKADEYGMYRAKKLSPSGSLPTQRWLMAGCYDAPNNRMVIWGGQSQSTITGDVWALSLTPGSESWTQLSPTGTAPNPTWQSSYAYDTVGKRLFVHGGYNGTTYDSQLFYLDLSTTNGTWVNTNATGGTGVRGAAMAYDDINNRLVCFGGYNGTVVNSTVRYIHAGIFGAWTTQATSNTPAARRSPGWGVVDNRFIMACGRPISGTWFKDTNELNFISDPSSWSWTSKAPKVYQTLSVPSTGLALTTGYHWQSWVTTAGSRSVAAPFGSNSESVADFIVKYDDRGKLKYYTGSTWALRPVKVWTGSQWKVKPIKRWNGISWEVLSPNPTVSLRTVTSVAANEAVGVLGTPDTTNITIPAATQVGDLLVLAVAQASYGTTVFNAIPGWTKQGEQRAGGAAHTLAVYTRVAQSGDAGSVVTIGTTNTDNTSAQIRVYANVSQSTPIDAPLTFNTYSTNTNTADAPTVTVSTENTLLVTIYTLPTANNITLTSGDWTGPAGFGNAATVCTSSTTNNAALASFDQLTSFGVQGPFTAVCTQARRWATTTIVVRGE